MNTGGFFGARQYFKRAAAAGSEEKEGDVQARTTTTMTTTAFRRLGLFGAPKEPEPTPKEGSASLRETLDLMEARERMLQTKIGRETAQATAFVQKRNRRAALPCLKRKKTYEIQYEQLVRQRENSEHQVMALEAAHVSVEAVQAMKVGTQSMKVAYKDIDVAAVDTIALDMKDQMDAADLINHAISKPLNSSMQFAMGDDDELLAELDELDAERADAEILSAAAAAATATAATATTSAPPPPTTAAVVGAVVAPPKDADAPVPTATDDDEEAQMRALEAGMAM